MLFLTLLKKICKKRNLPVREALSIFNLATAGVVTATTMTAIVATATIVIATEETAFTAAAH